jgi:TRAP-type uncharacterized transport system substrate-binding protein
MKRKPVTTMAVALIFALGSAYGGDSSAQDRSKPAAAKIERISIATGAIGGIYNVLGGGMAKLLREKLGGMTSPRRRPTPRSITSACGNETGRHWLYQIAVVQGTKGKVQG